MKKLLILLLIISICPSVYASGHSERNYRTFYKKTAENISERLPNGTKLTVVPLSNNIFEAKIVSEMIQVLLATNSLILVNRNQIELEKIREEAEFQLLGNVPEESAVLLGRLLEVDSIVVVSITHINYKYGNINIRVISVESGQIHFNTIKKVRYRILANM